MHATFVLFLYSLTESVGAVTTVDNGGELVVHIASIWRLWALVNKRSVNQRQPVCEARLLVRDLSPLLRHHITCASLTPLFGLLAALRAAVSRRVQQQQQQQQWQRLICVSCAVSWCRDQHAAVYRLCSMNQVYCRLNSALVAPRTVRATIGDRTFPAAAASVWNSLPESVRASPSLQVFRSSLKTELFARSYSCSEERLIALTTT